MSNNINTQFEDMASHILNECYIRGGNYKFLLEDGITFKFDSPLFYCVNNQDVYMLLEENNSNHCELEPIHLITDNFATFLQHVREIRKVKKDNAAGTISETVVKTVPTTKKNEIIDHWKAYALWRKAAIIIHDSFILKLDKTAVSSGYLLRFSNYLLNIPMNDKIESLYFQDSLGTMHYLSQVLPYELDDEFFARLKDIDSHYLIHWENFYELVGGRINGLVIMTTLLQTFLYQDMAMTKPIVAIMGRKGSGKSVLLNFLAHIFGQTTKKIPRTNDRDIAPVFQAPLVFLDENNDVTKEIQEMYCAFTSGVEYSTRKLFTNNQLTKISLHPSIFFTATHFRMEVEGLDDRTFFIWLKKPDSFLDEVVRFTDEDKLNTWLLLLWFMNQILACPQGKESADRMVQFSCLLEAIRTLLQESNTMIDVRRASEAILLHSDELYDEILDAYEQNIIVMDRDYSLSFIKSQIFPIYGKQRIKNWFYSRRDALSRGLPISAKIFDDKKTRRTMVKFAYEGAK